MSAGFYGFIDFVGYATGPGISKSGHGGKAAGRKHLALLLADARSNEASLIALMTQLALKKRIFQMWEEAERQRQEMLWGNALTAIVAEI